MMKRFLFVVLSVLAAGVLMAPNCLAPSGMYSGAAPGECPSGKLSVWACHNTASTKPSPTGRCRWSNLDVTVTAVTEEGAVYKANDYFLTGITETNKSAIAPGGDGVLWRFEVTATTCVQAPVHMGAGVRDDATPLRKLVEGTHAGARDLCSSCLATATAAGGGCKILYDTCQGNPGCVQCLSCIALPGGTLARCACGGDAITLNNCLGATCAACSSGSDPSPVSCDDGGVVMSGGDECSACPCPTPGCSMLGEFCGNASEGACCTGKCSLSICE